MASATEPGTLPVEPGATFAGYLIDAVLGQGGAGIVYRATSTGDGRAVALKVIRPWLAGDDAFHKRLRRESSALLSIDHPNVRALYEIGEHDGLLFLAMQYIHGEDLATLLDGSGAWRPSPRR